MTQQENVQLVPNQVVSQQGTLLGVVLDLSGSMRASLRNDKGEHYSRIEGLSEAFRHVLEDVQLLMQDAATEEQVQLRMFLHGFGLLSPSEPTVSSSIGDIFAILASLDEKVAYYRPLQSELEAFWLGEVAQMLEDGKVRGDAKEELRMFVERELREQAIQAEQQRSVARFQRWCASTCQNIERYDARMRTQLPQRKGFAFLLLLFALGLLWLLRGPMLLLVLLNRLFEAWLQRKLTNFQRNANHYATQQADRVVAITQKALATHTNTIAQVIEEHITAFIDREAFMQIRSYDANIPVHIRKNAFDREQLKRMYDEVSQQIGTIMSPQADSAWERSVFLLKRAAKALKIEPDWDRLKEKTIRCAHQVVWNATSPVVNERAKVLAKQRFTRAVLMTIVQAAKGQERTLSLQEIIQLIEHKDEIDLSLQELPIFGSSPLGLALTQTFLRLRKEAILPQNRGFRPAIVIISDGVPTDCAIVDVCTQAENIKQYGIPIICCFVTNRNVGRPWILHRRPGWFWPRTAQLMFSMASSVDEWPQVGRSLEGSRFIVKREAKLFIQVNHATYLQNLIEAILLPTHKE